jgi:hypothetical protein
MTKFADQLFDDLMREHGPALAGLRVPAMPKRRIAARPVLLAAGAGSLALAGTVGGLVAAGGGTPAYAVTPHSDGTVTLAVYQKSGVGQVNAKLRALGDDRVVVVPAETGCPSISSLPAPAVPASEIRTSMQVSTGGGVTVDAHGVPAGDILVVGFESATTSMTASSATLTSGPAPKCVSLPEQPPGGGPGPGTATGTGRAHGAATSGTGRSTAQHG